MLSSELDEELSLLKEGMALLWLEESLDDTSVWLEEDSAEEESDEWRGLMLQEAVTKPIKAKIIKLFLFIGHLRRYAKDLV
jgi:hypothetical protein